MNLIKTMAGFVQRLSQIIFELDEARAAVKYDEKYMDGVLVFQSSLGPDIREMFELLKRGEHVFKDEGCPLVERLKHVDACLIPFIQMRVWVNDIQRRGLLVPEAG